MVDKTVDYSYFLLMKSEIEPMRNLLWESFDIINSLAGEGKFETVAEKVDSALNASMETVADVLPTAPAPVLREGAEAAAAALGTLRSAASTNRLSPDYAAGRLAATVDILGYAASATVDDEAVKKAKQQPFAQILDLLANESLRNADIAAKLGKDKGQVSRLLEKLREMELVTSHRNGRDLFNALTPVGRLIVEDGVEEMARAPLSKSKVADLGAYNLGNLPSPSGVKQSQLPPRLSVAG